MSVGILAVAAIVILKACFPGETEEERYDREWFSLLHEDMRQAGAHWENGYMVPDGPESTMIYRVGESQRDWPSTDKEDYPT